MPLITPVITFPAYGVLKAVWTGVATYATWVFLNGNTIVNGVVLVGTDREIQVKIDPEDVSKLEIHELPENVDCQAINLEHKEKPVLHWSPITDANKYRAYYRRETGGDEEILANILVNIDATQQTHKANRIEDIWGGVHYWFRVEAIKDNGAMSAKALWPEFLRGLPNKPVDIDLLNVRIQMVDEFGNDMVDEYGNDMLFQDSENMKLTLTT